MQRWLSDTLGGPSRSACRLDRHGIYAADTWIARYEFGRPPPVPYRRHRLIRTAASRDVWLRFLDSGSLVATFIEERPWLSPCLSSKSLPSG